MTKEMTDELTGLYLYESAVEKMKRHIEKNPSGKYHITMVNLWNSEQYMEEYGSEFTLAIVGNLSMVLRYFYYDYGEYILFSRVQKDTFFIFISRGEHLPRGGATRKSSFIYYI